MQLVVREASAGPFLSQVLQQALSEQQLSALQLQQIKSKVIETNHLKEQQKLLARTNRRSG